MSNGISARDLERISAFLDNALPPREQASFEQRMKTEPALARALADLDRTRALLRQAPHRRVPRTFALRSDMVPPVRKAVFGGWMSLNLVSAAATLVLVLVFAGDIWANGWPLAGAYAPAAEAPQALMAEEPTAGDEALAPTPAEPAPEGEGEIELYAAPEDANQQVREVGAPFDLRVFLFDYARPLEIALGVVAIAAGLAAWWLRHNS
ncbi:MAG: hypothetical protein M1347_05100 [Chloroflexi bacterium]|nr:hypothetical protein [Chloroflexota bacterium]